MCVIPQSLVSALQLEPEDTLRAVGYDGQETEVATYFVDLEIVGYPISGVEVIAMPRTILLIGRDVLSHFILTLDGKNMTFEMIDP